MGKEIVLQGGHDTFAFAAETGEGRLVIGIDNGFKLYLGLVAEERLRRYLNDRYGRSNQRPTNPVPRPA